MLVCFLTYEFPPHEALGDKDDRYPNTPPKHGREDHHIDRGIYIASSDQVVLSLIPQHPAYPDHQCSLHLFFFTQIVQLHGNAWRRRSSFPSCVTNSLAHVARGEHVQRTDDLARRAGT